MEGITEVMTEVQQFYLGLGLVMILIMSVWLIVNHFYYKWINVRMVKLRHNQPAYKRIK